MCIQNSKTHPKELAGNINNYSVESSHALSSVMCLYKTDVSRTISVSIIRDPVSFLFFRSLMMGTEIVLETSVL